MPSVKIPAVLLAFALLTGCGNMMDDLNPSGTSKVPAVETGSTGPNVGQKAPDFVLSDVTGSAISLSTVYPAASGVVIYFTMWCPICDTHLDNMQESIIPNFPKVRFYAVDYVSGDVSNARNAVQANGYTYALFSVLVDANKDVYNSYAANMGTTVVIDAAGVIRMNEDYKDGSRLITALQALP
jgi:peroxiredoxin